MRQLLGRPRGHRVWTRRRALLTSIALVALGTAGGASPALANKAFKEEFLIFSQCPTSAAAICLYSKTTSGEFKIDLKTVPINKPVVLQGGTALVLTPTPLIPALNGETISKTPLEVPGGLVGIGGLGGEVTATAEIAGPVSNVLVASNNLLNEYRHGRDAADQGETRQPRARRRMLRRHRRGTDRARISRPGRPARRSRRRRSAAPKANARPKRSSTSLASRAPRSWTTASPCLAPQGAAERCRLSSTWRSTPTWGCPPRRGRTLLS